MYRFPAISHHSRKSPLRSISAKRSSGGFTAARILALSPAAWFRWNVGITVATGVSTWADQSGNGRDLLQATGASQPTKQADGSILFDGTAHVLKCSTFTLGQPETVYLLVKQVSWTSADRFFDGNTTDSGSLQQTNAGASPQIRVGTSTTTASVSDLVVGTYGVVVCVINGASSLVAVNNNTAGTGTAAAASMSGLTLGARGAVDAQFGNIEVREVIVFPVAHTPDVRAKIVGYLARLGGVSV